MQKSTTYTLIRQALSPLPLDAVVASPILYSAIRQDLRNYYGKKLGDEIFDKYKKDIIQNLAITAAIPVAITGAAGYTTTRTLKKATKSKALFEALRKIKKGEVKTKNLKSLLWQLPLLASAEVLAALLNYKQFKKLERKIYGRRRSAK